MSKLTAVGVICMKLLVCLVGRQNTLTVMSTLLCLKSKWQAKGRVLWRSSLEIIVILKTIQRNADLRSATFYDKKCFALCVFYL